MNIYAFSDTHNSLMADRFLSLAQAADAIVFCGDGTKTLEDLRAVAACPILAVRGNCDFSGKDVDFAVWEGHKIMCTHGHNYDVKYSLDTLDRAAAEAGADIVFYGHTHVPDITHLNGRWLINPGSLTRPRDDFDRTFCILHLDKNRIYPELISY